MTRLQVNLLLIGAGLAALAGGFLAAELIRAPRLTSNTAPGFVEVTGTDLQGRARKLSDLRGKVVVLNFWATWCPPCREEIPLLISAQDRYQQRGLEVIGLAIDQLPEVATYYREHKMNYPVWIADASVYQAMQAYGNTAGGLPFSVVLDRNGAIRARKLGIFRGSELDQVVEPLLAEKTAETR